MEEKEYETKNISITACSGDGNESFCRTAVSKYTSAGVTGQGVVSGADMNVGFMDLTTTERYESISFDFSAGAGKSDIETFVRQLRFTTANKVQKVSVCATTEGTSATTEITVNGKTVELKYFNGHYYGFVPDRISWNEAYKISKTLNFNGVQGYQTTSYGYGPGDGGFEMLDGQFSNWSTSGNVEPNGGDVTDEAYGFYGKYDYGRWNDNPDASYEISGYYIEFGGYPGDTTKIEDSLGQIIVSDEETTPEVITDGTYSEVSPSATPTATPAGTTGTTPGNGTTPEVPQASAAPSFTKEVEKTASDFVKDHFTDENGDVITKVTDLTRDKITSGEVAWKKLTDTEKQAVNQMILQKGGKYTGKKRGSTLVQVKIKQNKKVYLLYVYVTIY